jgi:peptidoglycan/xylan/chitin deacetylase (PgdA/CDA1 family)
VTAQKNIAGRDTKPRSALHAGAVAAAIVATIVFVGASWGLAKAVHPAAAGGPGSASSPRTSTAPTSPATAASASPANGPQAPSRGARVAKFLAPIATLVPRPPGPVVDTPRTMPVPILMYHMVGATPANAALPGLHVSSPDFVAQLRYLVAEGYEAVTLQQVYDFWKGSGTLPAHPVVLSFDDGRPCDFSIVAPLLNELHWPGVLNLIADPGPRTRMRTSEVRAMIAAGWEVDSHTVSHLNLTTLGPVQLAFELTASKSKLQRLFGVPVNFFCYPSGRYDPTVEAAVRAAGYLAATTTDPGFAHTGDLFALRRIRVSGGESLVSFAAELQKAW